MTMTPRHSGLVTLLLLAALAATACGRTAAEYLASGDAYFKAGRYQEAIVEYRNAVQQDASSGTARRKLGDAYMQIPDVGNAAREYNTAALLLPNDVGVQITAGNALLLGGGFEEARVCAVRALREQPKNIAALVLHANAMAGLKRTAAALAEIQKAIALDPTRGDTQTTLGVLTLAEGTPADAEAALRRAVDLTPRSADALVALASFYWAQGRAADAEAALQRAAEAEPDNLAAHRALATFYLGSGRAPLAEQHLLAVVRQNRSTPARLTVADYYISLGRAADAERLLLDIAREKDGYGEARSRLATLAYTAGRTADAHALIDATLKQDPVHPRALLTKGQFLVTERKFDEALIRAKAAVVADGRSLPAHYMLAAIYTAQQDLDSAVKEYNVILSLNAQSVAARMELARLYLARGEHAIAGQFAAQASEERPENVEAQLLRVRALVGDNNVPAAGTLVGQLKAANPSRADVHWIDGMVQLAKHDQPAARQAFERSLELQPDALEPLDALIALDLAAGAPARARARIEQRLSRNPDSSGLLVLAGRTYQATGDRGRAETALKRAIAVDPENPLPYETLAQVYAASNRLDDALAEFQALVARDRRSVGAHTMIAVLLQLQDKVTEAEQEYRKALEIDPRSAVAANNLAWLYADEGGDLDAALRLAETARNRLPDHPGVNDTLGWVYYKRGEAGNALPPFRACVQQDPRNPFCRYHLGLAYLKTGDTAHAREALQAALGLNAAFPGSADARAILASLR